MFVLQDWVGFVGLKMQSILLSGLRAPDAKTKAIKKCIRWMRAKCQIDADPQKQSYMQTVELTPELIDEAMDECEYLPVHYVHHFADAMAVISYFHPDAAVSDLAWRVHFLVAFLHRHRDRIGEQ